jgi:hypothetical protein
MRQAFRPVTQALTSRPRSRKRYGFAHLSPFGRVVIFYARRLPPGLRPDIPAEVGPFARHQGWLRGMFARFADFRRR